MKTTKKEVRVTRDLNFLLAAKREISLSTKIVRDRTKYTRKEKHKARMYV